MRRIVLVVLGVVTIGTVLTASVATAEAGDDRWQRAYVVMTGGLLAATAYYALQTYDTVAELQAQRQDANAERSAEQRRQLRSVRQALAGELLQLISMITVGRGQGANFMDLPSAAWSESFRWPDVLPEGARQTLFEVYAEVERINAIGRYLLSARGNAAETSAMGLERHTEGDRLVTKIRDFLSSGELITT